MGSCPAPDLTRDQWGPRALAAGSRRAHHRQCCGREGPSHRLATARTWAPQPHVAPELGPRGEYHLAYCMLHATRAKKGFLFPNGRGGTTLFHDARHWHRPQTSASVHTTSVDPPHPSVYLLQRVQLTEPQTATPAPDPDQGGEGGLPTPLRHRFVSKHLLYKQHPVGITLVSFHEEPPPRQHMELK